MVTTPGFLYNSYKRYKTEEQVLVNWLGETSQKCAQGPSPSGRRANTRAQRTAPPPPKNIDLKEFVPLAKTISKSGPPVEVPTSILQTLKNVIAKRKECAKWFAAQDGDERHQSSVNSHAYVITVFEVILGILSPKAMEDTANGSMQATVEDEEITLSNAFDALEVEKAWSDTESSVPETPSTSSTGTSAQPGINRRRTEPAYQFTIDDLAFPSYCFFANLDELRIYMRELWGDYRDGEVDLMLSSIFKTLYEVLVG